MVVVYFPRMVGRIRALDAPNRREEVLLYEILEEATYGGVTNTCSGRMAHLRVGFGVRRSGNCVY